MERVLATLVFWLAKRRFQAKPAVILFVSANGQRFVLFNIMNDSISTTRRRHDNDVDHAIRTRHESRLYLAAFSNGPRKISFERYELCRSLGRHAGSPMRILLA